jgi:hypothetical protein
MNTAKGFVAGFIGALLLVWILGWFSCGHTKRAEETTVQKSDTSTVKITGKGTSVPVITKTTPHNFDSKKPDTFWLPGKDVPVYIFNPDSSKCCENYSDLYAQFTNQTELSDTIWLDTLHKRGYVLLNDTIAANTLIGRSYAYNLFNTVITNTITKTSKQGIQMLIGGGVAGTQQDPLKMAELDLMLRGKKGGAIGINIKKELNTGETIYGFKKLWLISFRKK